MSTLPDFSKFGETSFSKGTRSQPNKSHLRIMGSAQQKEGLNGVMAFTAKHQNFCYIVGIMVNIIVNNVNHYVHNKRKFSHKQINHFSQRVFREAGEEYSHQYNIQFPFSQYFSFLGFFVVISGDRILNTDSKQYSMTFKC